MAKTKNELFGDNLFGFSLFGRVDHSLHDRLKGGVGGGGGGLNFSSSCQSDFIGSSIPCSSMLDLALSSAILKLKLG